jgi:hypothetical protein
MRPYQLNRIDYTGTTVEGKRYFSYQKNNEVITIATNVNSIIAAETITIIEFVMVPVLGSSRISISFRKSKISRISIVRV